MKAWCVKDIEYGLCPKMIRQTKHDCEKLIKDTFHFNSKQYKAVRVQVEITEIKESDDE